MNDALAKSWQFLEESDLIASEREVCDALERVAQSLTARLSTAYPLVLAVMGGAVVFAGQLLPRLRFPLDFDYIHVTRYGDATCGGGVQWRVPPPAAVRGRTVLVLDDILDHGATLRAIRDSLAAAGAARVECAVLVEKQLARSKPTKAEYVGLTIPDRFVFGYGMDAKGYWRNLPEIRAIKGM
jgi:hypoxanthine phosphoribosyltransferase